MFDSKNDGDRRQSSIKSAMRKSISVPTITDSTTSTTYTSTISLPTSVSDNTLAHTASEKTSVPTSLPQGYVFENDKKPVRYRNSSGGASDTPGKGRNARPSRSSDGKTLQYGGNETADVHDEDMDGFDTNGRPPSTNGTNPDDDTEDEGGDSGSDMSMDETVAYGGILRRESNVTVIEADITADMSEDMSIVTTSSTDEEKTMDFTVAIGGVLPRSPPKHAARNRHSIGYSLPESPNSVENRIRPGQTLEGDPSEEEDGMEETMALGGIMGDDTMSTISDQSADGREKTMTFSFGDISAAAQQAAERVMAEEHQEAEDDEDEGEEGGMSMTMAHGGIVSHQSPGSGLSQSLTRPVDNAPSFARPTVSSSQRSREPTPKKRNVFAPSPSPNKQTSTPKTGMEVAGEVAKRLSFGSVTSSAGKKRPSTAMDDVTDNSSAKKSRLSVSTTNVLAQQPAVQKVNIFAQGLSKSTSAQPAQTTMAVNLSASVPATRIPSPIKQVKRVSIAPSPAKPRQPLAVAPSAPRVSLAQPPKSPRRSIGVARSTTPQRLPPKSPGKSPALRRMLGENVEREEIEAAEQLHDQMGEVPTISLSRFLELVGVEFMENLPKVQRKSLANGLGHTYPMSSGESFHARILSRENS